MKRAEEYLNQLISEEFTVTKRAVIIELIHQVQSDAIDEAVKRCAEEAKTGIEKAIFQEGTYNYHVVDKQSILQVAQKMKGELK